MREIPIKNAKAFKALVDDDDYERVMEHTWYLAQRSHTMYAQRSLYKETGRRVYESMHNFILGIKGVDHIDKNGLNNQKSNLRPANQSQNNAGYKKKYGLSRYKGVHKSQPSVSTWRAVITVNGRKIYLGSFKDEEEAGRAYDEAAIKHFGDYAQLNFPEERR